jgi:signal transduction histidine kinase
VVDTLALALFVVTLPGYFAHLLTVCTTASCSFGQLSAGATHSLSIFGLSLHTYAVLVVTFVVITTLLCVVIAALLLFRRSDTWMALLVSFLLVVLATSNSTADPSILRPWLGSTLAVPVAGLANYLGAIALPLIFSLFPTGRFVPGFIRWLVLALLIIGVVFTLPFSPPALVLLLSTFFWISCLLGLAGAQIYRYRRVSTAVERQQTKWVIFGFSLAVLLALGLLLPALLFPPLRQPDSLYPTIWTLLGTFILILSTVVSLGFALLRYRLWDIDLIINRTLVYGILTACVVGFYVVVVGYLGAIFHTGSNLLISLLATSLVAVLFQPLREVLQRAVNRLFYGQRDEPYRVISRLGQRLEATLAPDAVLAVIVETVAQALKLPYTAVALKQDEEFAIAASYVSKKGEAPASEALLHLPLLYQSEQVGELLLAARARGESFTPADRRLLDDLARQVGIAAHAIQLTAELQRARERLVTAREEERRRLRRDLHDSLGPTLAALNLQAGAVRTLIPQDPVQATALVVQWRTTLRTAIVDIRRLVYDLRPPALDELGLTGAIREQAAQYSMQAGTTGVQMVVEVPDRLPPLPAAVEVATYRIAVEALTNVARHAQAHLCHLCLRLDEVLHLEITDDGIGLSREDRAGVGMLSMRERAEELGGSCTIEPALPRGTRVYARLPFPKE